LGLVNPLPVIPDTCLLEHKVASTAVALRVLQQPMGASDALRLHLLQTLFDCSHHGVLTTYEPSKLPLCVMDDESPTPLPPHVCVMMQLGVKPQDLWELLTDEERPRVAWGVICRALQFGRVSEEARGLAMLYVEELVRCLVGIQPSIEEEDVVLVAPRLPGAVEQAVSSVARVTVTDGCVASI
jgi:hypothetical protein